MAGKAKPKGKSMAARVKADRAYDRAHGIKEGSAKDKALDRKRGVYEAEYGKGAKKGKGY